MQCLPLQTSRFFFRMIKSLCAPYDYNTEIYKLCSKCLSPVSRYLLTRRTVFSKTVFSILTALSWYAIETF
jgi:hypothetical protein